MFGEHESAANKEHAQGIAAEACRDELMSDLVTYIGVLDFETRKDVVQIFCALIRITLDDGRQPGKDYVLAHPDVLSTLFYGCAGPRGPRRRPPCVGAPVPGAAHSPSRPAGRLAGQPGGSGGTDLSRPGPSRVACSTPCRHPLTPRVATNPTLQI